MHEIGVDIVRIQRIENLWKLYGNKFLLKIFNPEEIIEAQAKGHFLQSIAGKFAAKEAFIKATWDLVNSQLHFLDIIVLSDKHGKPYIKNLENAFLSSPEHIHLSISHEKEYAVAIVLID